MKRTHGVISLLLSFALFSCDTNTATYLGSDVSTVDSPTGALRLSVDLGPVGVLARAAEMKPSKLLLKMSCELESCGSSPDVLDTIRLSGSGSVFTNYSLASGNWHLELKGLDQNDSVLYFGAEQVQIVANRTTAVMMSLNALQARLRLRFPLRDSMTRFVVKLDNQTIFDSILPAASHACDTLVVDRDYLAASISGVRHGLSIRIHGVFNGIESVLFACDTVLTAISGENHSGALPLTWVGPWAPPSGLLNLSVSLGVVGGFDFIIGYPQQNTDTTLVWVMRDPSTGIQYRYKRFGAQIWMLDNLGAGCPGCSAGGTQYCPASYNYGEPDEYGIPKMLNIQAPMVCPEGWHIPDTSEWNELLRFAAAGSSDSIGLFRLRSIDGWVRHDGESSLGDLAGEIIFNGNDGLGFHLVPTRTWTKNMSGGSHSLTASYSSIAELWTSTPGYPVIVFGDSWANMYTMFYFDQDYVPTPHHTAAVRCLMDL